MMRVVRPRALALLTIALLPLCGACDAPSELPPPAPSPVTTTETFTATLAQLASTTHPFTVTTAGSVQVKLTAVEPLATMALGVAVTVGGNACGTDIAQTTNARAGATALSGTAAAGSYCVRVFDPGNIPAETSVNYTVEVVHP